MDRSVKELMKRIVVLMFIAILFVSPNAVSEQQRTIPGFGFVNSKDVAVRYEPNGDHFTRLPQDTCVWISEAKTDKKGVLWYRIHSGIYREYAHKEYHGWMMAKFIDAGNDVWNDVAEVSANAVGMIVRKKDGSVVIAGKQATVHGSPWLNMRRWAEHIKDARQVSVQYNRGYCLLDENGYFHTTDPDNTAFLQQPLRMMEGRSDVMFAITEDGKLINYAGREIETKPWMADGTLDRVTQMTGNDEYVLLLTDHGDVLAYEYQHNALGTPPPDWQQWHHIRSVDTAWIKPGKTPLLSYTGVRMDGTVLAHPQQVSSAVSGWTEIKKAEIGRSWIAGLKEDGTCVSAGLEGKNPVDVSGWTDIVDIEAAGDYLVGVKQDGTLVFSGSFSFVDQ